MDKELPNKSQTISILSTQLATLTGGPKIPIAVKSRRRKDTVGMAAVDGCSVGEDRIRQHSH
jgi:hypothetical protein